MIMHYTQNKCFVQIVISLRVRADNIRLFQPDKNSKKYAVRLVIPKSEQETIRQIQEGCEKLVDEYPFTDVSNLQMPLHDSNQMGYGDEYADTVYLNATSYMQPDIIDRDGNPIKNPNDIYDGIYVRAYFTLQPYDYKTAGIRCELTGIQKAKDGERFPDTYTKRKYAPITDEDFLA